MDKLDNIELNQLQIDVLVGSLLGDGHLRKRKPTHNSSLAIKRSSTDRDYLAYQYDIYKNICTDNGIQTKASLDKRTKVVYYSDYFETRCFHAFNLYHDKWYNNKIKIIPRDLVLNNQIVAIWLADDASFSYTNKNTTRIKTKIATNSFKKDECEFLCCLLNKLYATDFTVERNHCAGEPDKFQYVIVGQDHQSRVLIKEIDSIFPLKRKYDIWRSKEYDLFGNSNKHTKSKNIEKQIKIIDYILCNKKFKIGDLSTDLDIWFVNQKNGYKDLDPTVLSKLNRYHKNCIVSIDRQTTLKEAIVNLLDYDRLAIELQKEKVKMDEQSKCGI